MWQPTASLSNLQQRARLLAQIRQFFAKRQVMEVDTPCLSQGTVTDLHLSAFSTQFIHPLQSGEQTLYLQTSPEYAMKRLLCAGSGCIYQIAKAFRNEEAGRFHNPEFTLLEWYRVGFDDRQLMDEVDALVQLLLSCPAAQRLSYQQAFMQVLPLDPLAATLCELQALACELGYAHIARNERNPDTLLQLLFSEKVEAEIAQQRPCFVYDFPASQGALARIDPDNPAVARRFELYFKGIELANGFYELADAQEQAQRFAHDNQLRKAAGLPEKPVDHALLAALAQGLPDCAGVALGLDRLFMLALNAERIEQVLTFAVERC